MSRRRVVDAWARSHDAVIAPAAPEKGSTGYKGSTATIATSGTIPRPQRVKLMLNLSAETARRVRSAVYWTPGLRLSKLADQALAEAVDRLEKKRGEPFPQIEGNLEGGRPVAP
jgi:hypothetical protein